MLVPSFLRILTILFLTIIMFSAPSYAEVKTKLASQLTEKIVQIGQQHGAPLEAAIVWPNQPAKALVVLIAGSGKMDKNEHVGPFYPFLDIANGLADQGIASIRFDKRTFSHPEEFKNKSFTPDQEFVFDAIDATETLMKDSRNHDLPVILLGHSQGGTIIARVAKQLNPHVKGLILFASPSDSDLPRAALRQMVYLQSISPQKNQALFQQQINQLETEINHWENYEKTSVQSGNFPFGVSANYLQYLKNLHPTEEIKALALPTLVLQGGKDYNVLATKDFLEWQQVLQPLGKNVSFKLYPNLHHLFIDPDQYTSASIQHVDQTVLQDLGQWILQQTTLMPNP